MGVKDREKNITGAFLKKSPDSGLSSLYIVVTGGTGLLLNSLNLFAGTSTATVNVNASIQSTCQFTGVAQSLSFGDYDASLATPNDTSSIINVACSANTTVALSINNGVNASGAQRRMHDGTTRYLNYQIYTSAARSTIWNTTNTVTMTMPSSAPQPVTLYGRIPTGQSTAGAGGYNDTVTITATF